MRSSQGRARAASERAKGADAAASVPFCCRRNRLKQPELSLWLGKIGTAVRQDGAQDTTVVE